MWSSRCVVDALRAVLDYFLELGVEDCHIAQLQVPTERYAAQKDVN